MVDAPRVLVVDDEEVICQACRRILSPEGFQIDTSSDPREGLSLAAEKDYAAVLLDFKMPVMDGVQFLQALRKVKSDVPVIFITGYPSVPNAASAMRLGAADYVTKPFGPKELIQALERLLRHPGLEAEFPREEELRMGRREYLPKVETPALVAKLQERGRTVLGPTLVDGVVSLRPIRSADDLARGFQDEQNAGRYRTTAGDPELYFQHVVGPDGPKHYLFPAVRNLFSLHVEKDRFVFDETPPPPPQLAMLGVRACELAAMQVQDRVFGTGENGHFRCELDSYYKRAREAAVIVAVNCTRPGGTCFCASMGTGPQATGGFDLAMTELKRGFVIQVGSSRGTEILNGLPTREPSSAELELEEVRLQQARLQMGREIDTRGLRELLEKNLDHPVWEAVAQRCLGCGNCTMVCPTCFCSTVADSSGLDGRTATRTRQWESCYTHQFSYTTGGPVRSSIRARYRHWLRHKLSTWHEQFGCSGCVGCGRCITWCPVGIDLTKQVAAIRAGQPSAEVASGVIQRTVS
jgi:sulfhydrogenase subunit beta (sulfur reductase)